MPVTDPTIPEAAREGPGIACEVAAVIVTLKESARLRTTIESVRSSAAGRDVAIICVVNDPASVGVTYRDGIWRVGAGMNLGWAAGVHAGLAGVESRHVWAIQDDLVLPPSALGRLAAALDADPGLAAVGPTAVDSAGRRLHRHVDSRTPADDIASGPSPAAPFAGPSMGPYLPSAGQLIRRSVWDAVGGFDPWFYPWGYIDVDFSCTLRQAGWHVLTAPDVRMPHAAGTSTNTLLRTFCATRNRELMLAKWSDEPDASIASYAAGPGIIAAARGGRGRPRDATLAALRSTAGIAAADAFLAMMRWAPGNPYHALRSLKVDPAARGAFTAQVAASLRRRLRR